MAGLLEFPLTEGGTVVVEASSPAAGRESPVFRGSSPSDVLARSGETIQAALDRVKPAAAALVDTFGDLPHRPDRLEVTFGVSLNAEFGAIIASTSAGAHFSVTLTWEPHRSATPSTDGS